MVHLSTKVKAWIFPAIPHRFCACPPSSGRRSRQPVFTLSCPTFYEQRPGNIHESRICARSELLGSLLRMISTFVNTPRRHPSCIIHELRGAPDNSYEANIERRHDEAKVDHGFTLGEKNHVMEPPKRRQDMQKLCFSATTNGRVHSDALRYENADDQKS